MDSDPFVDDFYFSALYDEEELFPISDEKYAEELQMQEALMSSAASLSFRISGAKTQTPGVQLEHGESSRSQAFCEICMDNKTGQEMFRSNSCRHSYCSECIGGHIAAKIRENVSAVKCPDFSCKAIIEPHQCRSIVPEQVLERWESVLCESLISASRKFFCPYKDCSAVMVDDGSESVTVSECPNCRRLFCAQCKVGWHAGISCREFQSLNENEIGREDVMLMELAKEKQWRRCPRCC